jgi:pimeloyl-ACP methyl ester carboxylesterase
MNSVISKDGTRIAFERSGNRQPVILVDGALGHRQLWGGRPLAAELAKDFLVYTYDRRGRGESSDTSPYAVEREIEDIDTLIEAAGSPVYLFGSSSGAVLALKAAAKLGPARVRKLALYEPPLNSSDDQAVQEFARYTQQMAELLEANRRGDAVTFFLADALPPETLDEMRQSPEWPILEAVAPTLIYENEVLGNGSVPIEAAQAANMPVLVMNGSESPSYLYEAAEALARAMPHATWKTLEGLTHVADPKVLAPVLREFFAGIHP